MKTSNCWAGMVFRGIFAVLLNMGGPIGSAQETREWATCPAVPARYEHACVAVHDFIYILGGHVGSAPSDTVYFSQVAPDGTIAPWATTTQLPEKLCYHRAAASKDKIYVLGGQLLEGGTDKVYYGTVQADGTVPQWKETSPLPKKMHVGSVVVCKDNIYYIGGFYWRGVWSAKIKKDGSLGEWEEAQHLISPRGGATAFVHNDYIYLCGGNTGHTPETRKAEVFRTKVAANGTLEEWTNISELPLANDAMAGVLAGKKIVLLGGGAEENKALSATIKDNGDLGDWTEEKWHLPKPLWSFDAVYVNGWIYMVAGFTRTPDGKLELSNAVYGMSVKP
ncbi:MAG: hypothetical protein HY360_16290 [Verrucomicrobia bacterium]|nr:hypothetical protein [Verrucomicrobiota bacterium]